MADLEKKILEAPKLPNNIQGDGRYLMSLLKSFLEQTAEQVNLANGFGADEINPNLGNYPTPKNFFLSFTRLGGEFTWTHLLDLTNFAYYELRLDTNIGDNTNLLERTVNNSSTKMSVNYVDSVYLYAVSKDGKVSNPATINYSKPRPDAPQEITITKTNEGTLVSFGQIPTNCIGSHIYINGTQYTSHDNIYLIPTEYIQGADKIEVAFYDDFGDGEMGELYLVLPDVTGLLVERNNSQLDFYWDAINLYNVKYVVKVSDELSWEKGIELFRTTTNDKNRYIYPNTGRYYIMVKAHDEFGNYSKNATYQVMDNELEIDKNVIFTSDQQEDIYSGNKINVFYDPVLDGITLERESLQGEYLFGVDLPQKYRARNWLESVVTALDATNDVLWNDADAFWKDAEQPWGGIIGDIDGISFKQQISTYKGIQDDDMFAVLLHGNLLTESQNSPVAQEGADDFRSGRWNGGLYISEFTKLQYHIPNYSTTFSLLFNLRITKVLPKTILLVLANDDGSKWMRIEYDQYDNKFSVTASDDNVLQVDGFVDWRLNTVDKPTFADSVYTWGESLNTWASIINKGAVADWLTFGISQSENERKLYIYSYNKDQYLTGEIKAVPIEVFSMLYCYPQITI